MTQSTKIHLRKLPSLNDLLQHCEVLQQHYGREFLHAELNQQLALARKEITTEQWQPQDRATLTTEIARRTETSLAKRFSPSIQPVINLTGVILHTNLGRAPYPQAAIDAMVKVAGACNLEYNLNTGKRGRRDDHVEEWICALTGAQAATTVNNNAAAVLLVLNTLAAKKEVIVSRGELIEIGGSFRLPAIMKKAGCKLKEVGTTNRTHLQDYQSAINKRSAALMKVHTSNYEIAGFNNSIDASELAQIAKDSDLPLIDDMGSGSLIDLSALGLPEERTARQALAEGVDIITFSGDKLLGGPQCGIIAGSRDLIKRIEKNPMKRAMRLDKITLAALEAVLKLYARPKNLATALPALRMLTRKPEQLRQSVNELNTWFKNNFANTLSTRIEPCESQIGSGALPTKTLSSFAVVITPVFLSVDELAARLRELPAPIVGRIQRNELWLDVRAMEDDRSVLNMLAMADFAKR